MIPPWTRTIRDLQEAAAEAIAHCMTCQANTPVDLDIVKRQRGELYSFWNRYARCRASGCKGRVFYVAKREGGGWPVNMHTPDNRNSTNNLHDVWRADRDAALHEAWAISAMLKLRRRRNRIRAAARAIIERRGPAAEGSAFDDLFCWSGNPGRLQEAVEIRREVLRLQRAKALDEDDLPEEAVTAAGRR